MARPFILVGAEREDLLELIHRDDQTFVGPEGFERRFEGSVRSRRSDAQSGSQLGHRMLAGTEQDVAPSLAPGEEAGAERRKEPCGHGGGLAAAGCPHHAEQPDLHRAGRQLSDQSLPTEEVGGVLRIERGEALVRAVGLADHFALSAVEPAQFQPDDVVRELEVGGPTPPALGQPLRGGGEPPPCFILGPAADHLVHPTWDPTRCTCHRFEGNVVHVGTHVQPCDPFDAVQIECGERRGGRRRARSASSMSRREDGSGRRVLDEPESPIRAANAGGRGRRPERASASSPGDIQVIQDHHGGVGRIRRFPHRRRSPAPPLFLPALRIGRDHHSGRSPRRSRRPAGSCRSGRAGDEHDTPMPPSGLAPCPAEPMHLVLPVDRAA